MNTPVMEGTVCAGCGQLRAWDRLYGFPPVCADCKPVAPDDGTALENLHSRGLLLDVEE